jgi:hypothetical protein
MRIPSRFPLMIKRFFLKNVSPGADRPFLLATYRSTSLVALPNGGTSGQGISDPLAA